MAYSFGSLTVDILALLVASIFVLVLYFKHRFNHWKKNNIPYIKPTFPFGNIKDFIVRKKSLGDMIMDLYTKLKKPGVKYGGVYFFSQTQLMPIDLDVIKMILTKDFQHFTDHGIYYNEEKDPLTANLFALDGLKWRNLRAKLSPTFTSGKLKMMFPTLVASSQELKSVVDETIQKGESIDIKEILARFTTDIISSCAFGLESDSLHEPENEFRKWGKRVFELKTLRDILGQTLAQTFPALLTYLNMKVVDEGVSNFYMGLVKDIIQYRETNNVKRKDFMHLLLQLKNDGKLHDEDNPIQNSTTNEDAKLTFNEIAAQCFIFFLGGFETSSTTMTFVLYELSRHQDVQDKLRNEILRVLEAHNGQITYDSIMEMTYMDQVINEALRKYPPVPFLNRICTKDYKLPGSDYVIKKGERIVISVTGIHTDPDYYPKPDEFDPERFSEENKAKRHAYAHIPFGEGPRICIGMRFGLMQTKVGLTLVLSNYKLKLNPKTPVPLTLNPKSAITSSLETIWLDGEKLVN